MNNANKIPELDGIRGLAIALVLVYHFGGFEGHTAPEKLLASIFGLGWSGVDLFFVLSGFLITGILLKTKESTNYFRIFYLRRFLRILPLYAAVLLTFFHVIIPIAHSLHKLTAMAINTEPWYWLYLANWPIGHHNSISFLVPFWSLSVEEQFYLAWPLVVLCCSNKALAYISGALIITALLLRCAYSPDPGGILVYVWTPFRMDGLAMGAICALIYRNRNWREFCNRWLTPVGIAAGGAVVLLCGVAGSTAGDVVLVQRFGYTLLGLLYGAVVLRCAIRSGSGDFLCRSMRGGALPRLGTVSYGVYLLHYTFVPLLDILFVRIGHYVSIPAMAESLLKIVIGSLLAWSVAELSWRIMERRIMETKGRWPYRYSAGVKPSVSERSPSPPPLIPQTRMYT